VSDLTITDVETLTFTYRSREVRDEEGHGHPGPEHDARMTLLRVRTNAGVDGYCFGGSAAAGAVAKRMLVGMNPLDRELIFQRLKRIQRLERRTLLDRDLSVIDQALWDVAGNLTGLPVNKLLGGFREKVPAYASTMCGDDIPGGLDTPEAYADFAEACQAQGYPAFKMHTWMPPLDPDPKRVIAACQAVRERVGPEMKLMLDPHHDYTREDALFIGRALEELDFYWIEEPMDEYNVSSYVWLAEQLDLPVCGPETAEGKLYTRAEWIVRGASDISRVGLSDVGGITPAMKIIHLCESFGMRCETHGGGAGTLQVMGAMAIPGEFYERGLLHPHLDYEARTPWLKEVADPIDAGGFVHISQQPGLGVEIDWDFVNANVVQQWS
jgi:L-alanine-DL-glutamate epimerase-like enolase superfamily enzyme